MFKKTFTFLVLLCLFSCHKEKKSSFTEIDKIQEKARKAHKDSILFYIEDSDKRLSSIKSIPDSIQAYQDYLYGLYFSGQGNLDSASVRFQKAVNTIKKGPIGEKQVNYFYWAWDTYLDKEEYGECIAISQKFQNILNTYPDSKLQAIAHGLDKAVYLRTHEFQKALKSSSKEIKFSRATKDTSRVVNALISRTKILDDVHRDRNEVFRILDSLEKEHKNFSSGINRMLFGQYGVHLFYENRFKEAASYYNKGLFYAKQIENPVTQKKRVSNIYNNLAEVSLELKEYRKAKGYLDTLHSLDVTSLENRQQRAYLMYKLRLATETNQNFQEILADLDSLNSYQNTTYQEKYTKDLEALKVANENEKVLQLQKQETEYNNFKLRTSLLIGGVVVLLLGLLGLFIYRQKRFALERKNLMTQQRLLRAQMNPHFTFNTLSVINRLVDKDPVKAKNYLVKFSRLLASIFENSTFNYVSLEKELDALKEYMDLQQMVEENKFTYQISLNDVEPDLVYVPGMLLQPIIENSIKHGFSESEAQGKIVIDFKEEGRFILCKISDNGKGIHNQEDKNGRTSSTKLIASFLEKVTKRPFIIQDKKDILDNETGVLVTFYIPFKENLND